MRGESSTHRWIPLTKASDTEHWRFLWSALERFCKQSRRRWFETPSFSLWRHCNVVPFPTTTESSLPWKYISYESTKNWKYNHQKQSNTTNILWNMCGSQGSFVLWFTSHYAYFVSFYMAKFTCVLRLNSVCVICMARPSICISRTSEYV